MGFEPFSPDVLRKPLIVTCSKDCTIRVWNYKTKGMELAKKFREELFRWNK